MSAAWQRKEGKNPAGGLNAKGRASAKADKVVSSKITEMKQTIEVLEEEKEQLVEQVTVMQNEIITIKSAPVQQPFDVLAIVPDSADRK